MLGLHAILRRGDLTRPFRFGPMLRMGALVALALASLLAAAPAQANDTWYVDNTNAQCSDTGPGTKKKPYRSISAALAAHRDSGVTIVVHGGPYREKVVISASGSGASPIVVRTDGTPVVIDGSDDFSQSGQWVASAGSSWHAAAVTWDPVHVFADGVRLQPSTAQPSHLQVGEWRWIDGSGLYVNVGGGNPASHAVAVGHRTHGFYLSGRAHVFIDGFTILRAQDFGVEVVGSADVVVKRNIVRQCGSAGIGARASVRVQVFGNTVSDNDHHGIEFRAGVSESIIDHNESFANVHQGEAWATGIYLAGSSGNRIENNRLHDNQDSGCEIQSGSNDNVLSQNIAWSNGDHGFMQLYSTGTLMLNDVAWGNHTEGFSVEGSSTGTRLYNCISLNRAIVQETYCLFVDSTSMAGFDADHNVYWNIAEQPPIKFGKVKYANVAAFQAGTGIGPSSFGADPRFVDAAHGDFHLRADSPAIDAATSSVPGWELLDADGLMRMDAPDTPNTGAGPVGFADRGAFEYQGSVLAVGDRAGGVSLALSPAFPNPSRRAVTFTLQLGSATDVDFAVYDLLGREVWREHGVRPAGASSLRWSLTGADGARVANGLYLARVRHGSQVATARFMVAR
ncbi:MAG TPA: right-handed parallel beta-helix repeat-containing protein [Methylomirabilota bacterium]|nr:right-handed parallel beta-helix repeat-containing protein [Methylomirabilota bacterium]